MQTVELMQSLKFPDGTLRPTEAKEVLLKIIEDQIDFYKLQHLSQWIKNNTTDPNVLHEKISQLEQNKKELEDIIQVAKTEGCSLNIEGDFKLSLTK